MRKEISEPPESISVGEKRKETSEPPGSILVGEKRRETSEPPRIHIGVPHPLTG